MSEKCVILKNSWLENALAEIFRQFWNNYWRTFDCFDVWNWKFHIGSNCNTFYGKIRNIRVSEKINYAVRFENMFWFETAHAEKFRQFWKTIGRNVDFFVFKFFVATRHLHTPHHSARTTIHTTQASLKLYYHRHTQERTNWHVKFRTIVIFRITTFLERFWQLFLKSIWFCWTIAFMSNLKRAAWNPTA